jgi:hypothetical protein
VSEPAQTDSSAESPPNTTVAAGAEELDGVLVTEQQAALGAQSRRSLMPATQAAAVAASGFLAGAALVGLARRRHGRHTPVRAKSNRRHVIRGPERVEEILQIVGSRSFLIDVHLLHGSGRDR